MSKGANSVFPPEFLGSVERFQILLLECRPDNPIEFAVKFFEDDQLPNNKISHAVQSLPYLLLNTTLFRSRASEIYTSELSQSCEFSLHRINKILKSDKLLPVQILEEVLEPLLCTISSPWAFDEFLAVLRLLLVCQKLMLWIERLFRDFTLDIGGTDVNSDGVGEGSLAVDLFMFAAFANRRAVSGNAGGAVVATGKTNRKVATAPLTQSRPPRNIAEHEALDRALTAVMERSRLARSENPKVAVAELCTELFRQQLQLGSTEISSTQQAFPFGASDAIVSRVGNSSTARR